MPPMVTTMVTIRNITPPTVPPTMAGTLSGSRQKELTESQSFDWTGLHQHHTLHAHCLFIFTIVQDNIHTNNEVELSYWASLCAVSWQWIHTSASFHTLYSGWHMLVSHSRPTSSTMSEVAGTQHRSRGVVGVGGRGGLVVKSNDCRAKAIRDDQGSPPRQWGKKRHPPYQQHCLTV